MPPYFLCKDYLKTVWKDLSVIGTRKGIFYALSTSVVAQVIMIKSYVNL